MKSIKSALRGKPLKQILFFVTAVSLFLCGCGQPASLGTKAAPLKELETAAAQTEGTQEPPAEETPAGLQEAPQTSAAPQETPAEPSLEPAQTPEPAEEPTKPTMVSGLACPSVNGALHVDGTQLVDQNGNAVQLKGVSTHGLAWFPQYVNEDLMKELHETWHANVFRLAMYTAEYGGYCSGGNKSDLKALIQRGVEYATAQDMYVIIDWHILSDGNPNTNKEEAKAFFKEMAQTYADYNNVLYEICNEPNGGTTWSDVKSYAEELIPIIREYDSEAIILVGSPTWSQNVDQAAADPITGYDNIMYTLHFYAATHKDSLRKTMTAAIDAGLPIFVSEYGICDASGNGAIDEKSAAAWVSTMNAYGVSYVAWSLSNKAETASIFSSGCNKTSGFAESDLSDSGKWLYQMLTGQTSFEELDRNALAAENGGNGSGSGNGGNGDNGGNGNNGGVTPSQTPVLFTNGDLDITVSYQNGWESGSETFYQYAVTLKNSGSSACTSWAIDITFSDSITLSQGWCGNYTANGKTLHITSADYNGSIAAGAQVGDIGFIISGPSGLSVQE